MLSSPTSTSRKLIAAAASVALVGAGMLALGHHVAERHEVCAEHGELVHVEGGSLVVVDAAKLSTDEHESEHGEHCAIAWSAPENRGQSDVGQRVRDANQATATRPAIERVEFDRARYRLAPKSSPPV